MKAPVFWSRRGLPAFLLLPLSAAFWLGGKIRRIMATPYRAKIPVICIGNIVAGGAGKTPTALAVAQILLQNGAKPVFVTRGYGGKQRGPLRVDPARHSAQDVGDEALLLARIAPVWIGRDRAAAIKTAEAHGTHIVMDDGLQNPSVIPDLAFLVMDGDGGLGNGFLIPAGPLRETFAEAIKRVAAIIAVGENADDTVTASAKCPVLHAQWQPDLPADFPRTQKFLAFAGIGRPAKFYATCAGAGLNIAATQDFPDHHTFSASDLAGLKNRAAELQARLLTTQKDWVRLPQHFRPHVTAFAARLVFGERDKLMEILKNL